ncbi:unnamed protein product, partial [Ixodes pacificus]
LVYNSLFYSHLNYCNLVWGTTISTNLERIHLLQKKAIRAIADVPFQSHTSDLFKKFRIINVHPLYSYRLSTSLKIELIRNTNFLVTLGRLSKNINIYPTRGAECWGVVTPRTNYGTQMLRHNIPNSLNLYESKNLDWNKMTIGEIRSLYIMNGHDN